MFTSVLEKTKEIGIMKAIGARNQDILLIFLFNAAFIGLVGTPWHNPRYNAFRLHACSYGWSSHGKKWHSDVTFNSMAMALSVSVTVGILAGIIPAYQASKA